MDLNVSNDSIYDDFLAFFDIQPEPLIDEFYSDNPWNPKRCLSEIIIIGDLIRHLAANKETFLALPREKLKSKIDSLQEIHNISQDDDFSAILDSQPEFSVDHLKPGIPRNQEGEDSIFIWLCNQIKDVELYMKTLRLMAREKLQAFIDEFQGIVDHSEKRHDEKK